MNQQDLHTWQRCYAHVDMKSFFASIEQLDFPALRNQPVAITSGIHGSTIITASYEARAFGIKTGTPLYKAKQRCPHLIHRPARHHRYNSISQKIMQALAHNISDAIEIFSVDECFLYLTPVLKLYPNIQTIAHTIRQCVTQASEGLPCTIGISEGKLTAKFAGEQHKGKITIIPPHQIAQTIAKSPVNAICGIGKHITHYLNNLGLYTCGDVANAPMSILGKRFGPAGRRLYSVCCGHDPQPIKGKRPPKQMGHSKVIKPNTTSPDEILSIFRKLTDKLCARLRVNDLCADQFWIGIRIAGSWSADYYRLAYPSSNSQIIWQLVKNMLKQHWHGEGLYQLQITATRLHPYRHHQLDLFEMAQTTTQTDCVRDQINQRFGEHSLVSAQTLQSS